MELNDRLDRQGTAPPSPGARLVAVPAPHEGIGRALRCAYLPPPAELPGELRDLLARLD